MNNKNHKIILYLTLMYGGVLGGGAQTVNSPELIELYTTNNGLFSFISVVLLIISLIILFYEGKKNDS